MGYAIAARWVAKPGEEENVLRILQEVIPLARDEPGCKFFQGSRDPDDQSVFFLFELYADEAAFTAHTQTPHFQERVLGDAIPRLAERERAGYVTFE